MTTVEPTQDPPTCRRRRLLEAAALFLLVTTLWTLDTFARASELRATGRPIDPFRLVTDQATSALAAFVLLGFVAAWLRRFPLDLERPIALTAFAHLAGSMVFATGHYAGLVLLRKLVYGLRGLPYMSGQRHLPNLVYEYQKDVKIYLFALALFTGYALWRRRLASGAVPEPGDAPVDASEEPGPGRSRLAVQTRQGERYVPVDRIEYLEAARNYVVVHSEGRRFLVRSSLGALAERLPSGRFLRCHRSFYVARDRVVGFRDADAGSQLALESGARVPVSRRYREAVRAALDELTI